MMKGDREREIVHKWACVNEKQNKMKDKEKDTF